MKEKQIFYSLITGLFILWFIGMILPTIPSTSAAQNQTVLTKLNITNTEPQIYNVTVTPNLVTLSAGSSVNVICNATVWDYNGVPSDLSYVNATLYLSTTNYNDPKENSTKYITSCTNATTFSSTTALYTCNFTITYYARNGTWNCTVFAVDNGDLNGTNSNTTTIQPLIAINVSDEIDFGNVPVFNTSDEKQANITNFGNVPINISVRGYGGQNESLYSNLSMICEYGNISIDLERYTNASGKTWNQMINLTDTNTKVNGLTVNARNDSFKPINYTYWKIKVPGGVGGKCNGTVVFTASNAQP